jgi:cysteine desulfuration protein SufE
LRDRVRAAYLLSGPIRTPNDLREQPAVSALETIKSDFALLDDWEDRYRYVIELGRGLAPLGEGERTEGNKGRGCVSQVWLATELVRQPNGCSSPRLHFRGDSDAHIVRGLIAILFTIYQDQTAEVILATDARSTFAELGLHEHLTPQRSNGFAAMVERIRADARAVAYAAEAQPS